MTEKKRALAVAMVFAGAVSGQALAGVEPSSQFQQRDLFRASEDFGGLQVLSPEEMESTEGAVNPLIAGAVIGAGTAAAGYANGVRKGDYPYSTKGLVGNMVTGATIGALTNGAGAAAGGGFTAGANVWRANGAAANFGANQVWRQNCGRTSHGPMCGK